MMRVLRKACRQIAVGEACVPPCLVRSAWKSLSEARTESFVAELCDLSDLVLFSAAVPGQGAPIT
jgi:hypothetical protein